MEVEGQHLERWPRSRKRLDRSLRELAGQNKLFQARSCYRQTGDSVKARGPLMLDGQATKGLGSGFHESAEHVLVAVVRPVVQQREPLKQTTRRRWTHRLNPGRPTARLAVLHHAPADDEAVLPGQS